MENQTKKPHISVIVPVYCLEDYIGKTLESILVQTYQNLEILVVDDGSTDNSWTVIKDYAAWDKRIVPIHQENGGVTSARLNGVAHATGEWIGFVDGDDQIEPDMYGFLLNNALKYGADISHCGYQMIFDDGRVHYFHNTGCLVKQDRTTGLKDLLDGSLVEPGLCNKLFHKTLFHSLLHTDVMPRDIKINEDLLMNYYLFSQAKLSVFEDQCKYHYIVRKTSASRLRLNKHKIYDPIRVKQIILDSCDQEMYTTAKIAYISTCINVYNSLMLEKNEQYCTDENVVREKIVQHKTFASELCGKRRFLAELILTVPALYRPLYCLYAKYFQYNKYE